MAKTKTTAADLGCIAVAGLILLLAVAGPLALAIWCIFSELRARAHRGVRSVHEVLDPNERTELENAEALLDHFNDEIERSVGYGLRSGFSQRADGMFDARRIKARELNYLLESLQAKRNDAQLRYDEVQRRLGGRMSRWLNARAGLVGSRTALITFVVVFVAVVASTGGNLSLSSLLFGEPGAGSTRMTASFTAMAVAIVAMLIARSTTRASLVA
ncbi:hypothetical protein [Brevundimonas sp.]|uniref:hypothetical protein n=1 Tax=Brevundimonas sp. TaxID=1871086 RepID=UPI002FC6FCDA